MNWAESGATRRRFRPPQSLITLNSIEDLKQDMVLEGIITNIADFGIFVSFGRIRKDWCTVPKCAIF